MTVPNETMSVKEIMQRFMRGQKIDDAFMRQASYDSGVSFDSEDLEEVSRMDMFEREQLANELKQENQEKNKKLLLFKEQKQKEKKASEDRQRSERATGGDARSRVRQDIQDWEDDEAERKEDDRTNKNPAKKTSRPLKHEPE